MICVTFWPTDPCTCHIALEELVSITLFKKFLPLLGHLIQVNDKGQLRLSVKALLPVTNAENHPAKSDTADSTKDVAASSKTDKSMAKKSVYLSKDGAVEEKTRHPKDVSSAKSSTADDNLLPQRKVFKRIGRTSKEVSTINKVRTKKSSGKEVSSISNKDGSSLVDGGAKVGWWVIISSFSDNKSRVPLVYCDNDDGRASVLAKNWYELLFLPLYFCVHACVCVCTYHSVRTYMLVLCTFVHASMPHLRINKCPSGVNSIKN